MDSTGADVGFLVGAVGTTGDGVGCLVGLSVKSGFASETGIGRNVGLGVGGFVGRAVGAGVGGRVGLVGDAVGAGAGVTVGFAAVDPGLTVGTVPSVGGDSVVATAVGEVVVGAFVGVGVGRYDAASSPQM